MDENEVRASVELWREMAAVDPERRADLASALGRLADQLAGAGRWVEAVPAAEEAVAIRRARFAVDPDAERGDLAAAVFTLGRRLGEAGRRADALAAVTEAVELSRDDGGDDDGGDDDGGDDDGGDDDGWDAAPDGDGSRAERRRRRAALQADLGYRLAQVGRFDEAVEATAEAVALRRSFVTRDDPVPAGLAQSLINLGYYRTRSGDVAAGLATTEEALSVVGSLPGADRGGHLESLARGMIGAAVGLFDAARFTESRVVAGEAVRVSRDLVAADGDSALPVLAAALSNLGFILSGPADVDDDAAAEAVAACEEAVEVLRRLSMVNPDVREPDLARALSSLTVALAGSGRIAEATSAAQDAFEAHRVLVEIDPAAFVDGFGAAARVLATLQLEEGRVADASATLRDAIARVEPVATTGNVDDHRYVVAMLTETLGDALLAAGDVDKARASYADAVAAHRSFVAVNRARYLPGLAATLDNAARELAEAGHRAEAIGFAREADTCFRELARTDPVSFDAAASAAGRLVADLTAPS